MAKIKSIIHHVPCGEPLALQFIELMYLNIKYEVALSVIKNSYSKSMTNTWLIRLDSITKHSCEAVVKADKQVKSKNLFKFLESGIC